MSDRELLKKVVRDYPEPGRVSDARETLERLAARLESDGFGADMRDATAIREVLAHQKINEQKIEEQTKEIERLRVAVRLYSEQASEEMDKIDAALAIADKMRGGQGIVIREMVKALRGGDK